MRWPLCKLVGPDPYVYSEFDALQGWLAGMHAPCISTPPVFLSVVVKDEGCANFWLDLDSERYEARGPARLTMRQLA